MGRGVAGGLGPTGFGPSQVFNPGGGGGGLWDSLMSGLGKVNSFVGSDSFDNWGKLGSLALQGYGLNKSLGIAQDQLGILKDQENRAATAQNFQTNNSLAMALQMTTPGTPEHEAVKNAIQNGTYAV